MRSSPAPKKKKKTPPEPPQKRQAAGLATGAQARSIAFLGGSATCSAHHGALARPKRGRSASFCSRFVPNARPFCSLAHPFCAIPCPFSAHSLPRPAEPPARPSNRLQSPSIGLHLALARPPPRSWLGKPTVLFLGSAQTPI